MAYSAYVIYSERYDKYYIGQTHDFINRLHHHNNGFSKFTSPYAPWVLKCLIEKKTRSEALILEKKLKNLNREKLIRFIEKYS